MAAPADIPKRTITEELYCIVEAVKEGHEWESILKAHCKRTEQPAIENSAITVEYDPGDHGFEHEQCVTWKGREYSSSAYPSNYQAREDLFKQMVQSVIAEELDNSKT